MRVQCFQKRDAARWTDSGCFFFKTLEQGTKEARAWVQHDRLPDDGMI